ncbi:hypothetical protein [Streptomyces sp. NPDC059708]|uniref:hypothetical protein n=1 Tax=Streptomyces sp. NPDC059708 TaxID=3346916 RepID=UPI003679B7F8
MTTPLNEITRPDGDLQMVALKCTTADQFRAGELAEQRHQFLDLDADSVCPMAGACRYPYLTAGGAS